MWFLHQVLINSWILSTCSSCLRKLPSISSLSCSIKGLGQASGFAVMWIFFFLKQKINIATLQESTADIIQCCYRNHRCVPKQNISMKSEAEHRMPHCACTTIRQSPEKKQWSNPSATPPHTIQRLYQLHPHLLPYERRQWTVQFSLKPAPEVSTSHSYSSDKCSNSSHLQFLFLDQFLFLAPGHITTHHKGIQRCEEHSSESFRSSMSCVQRKSDSGERLSGKHFWGV